MTGHMIETAEAPGALSEPDSLHPALWQPCLKGWLGNTCLYDEEIPSTNTALIEDRAAVPGTVCLCNHQTAGRGRMDRSWQAEKGKSLTVSVLLKPLPDPALTPLISFAAAMAMADAVEAACGLCPEIKWPNDLLLRGKKICGILASVAPHGIVLGTGLNVGRQTFPPEFAGRSAALADFLPEGEIPRRRTILVHYLTNLERCLIPLEAGDGEELLRHFRRRCVTLGRDVTVIAAAETYAGHAVDIAPGGGLVVRRADGRSETVLAGDVSIRPAGFHTREE